MSPLERWCKHHPATALYLIAVMCGLVVLMVAEAVR